MAGPLTIRLQVPSDAGCLTVVRALVGRIASLAGFADEDVEQIVLAVDEACTNVIRHQYDGRDDGRIDVDARLDREAGRVEFVLRDYGPTRDPSAFSGRQLGDVRPGGLGLHIMRNVMDEMDYRPAEGEGMELRMTKCVTAPHREDEA